MHSNELWQVYNNNGTPIPGKGAYKDEFDAHKDLIMGNAHIWFWKPNGQTVAILLQKRSLAKPTRPGWFHISAGGHINVGETPVAAALRETEEEMGLKIEASKLHFIHAVRIVERDPRDIVHVFLYKLRGDEKFIHTDGEADSYEWRSLDNFKKITKDAANHNLVPQGTLYFETLIAALEHLAFKR
ncbi:MAG TPA: NUDIX domain-containing protein [Candidatus Saccharimonadales bacterium]|nr:NUDIX domain-containing protein [Candidatus Saccharimonadales bacterium]